MRVDKIIKIESAMMQKPNSKKKSPKCVGVRVKSSCPLQKVSLLICSFYTLRDEVCAQRIKKEANTMSKVPVGTSVELVKILNLKIISRVTPTKNKIKYIE